MRIKGMSFWKYCCVAAVATLALCMNAAQSFGGFTVATNDIIKFQSGPGADGEFIVRKASDAGAPNTANDDTASLGMNSFRTFCVQTNEYMNFAPATFKVLGISSNSVANNGTSNPSGALQKETALLYSEFLLGRATFNAGNTDPLAYKLFGANTAVYTFGSSLADSGANNASANALQTLIWKYQGQNASLILGSGWASNALVMAYDAALAAKILSLGGLSNVTTGSIKIMNLAWNQPNNGQAAQDMLIDSSNFQTLGVPEPSSMVIFGLGAIGFVVRSRRRQQSCK